MKWSPKTLSILKSFHTINKSICINPGNVLRTCTPTKSILAQAKVDVEFNKKFCVHDIGRLLNTISLYSDPDIEIEDRYLTISDNRSSVNYVLAAENLIVKPSDRNIEMPEDCSAHFELSNDDLQKLFKAMSILSLRELAIIGDGDLISIKGIDPEGKVLDTYSQVIGPNTNKFKAILKLDNLKILPGDYSVKVAKLANSVNVANFKGRSEDVEYWISVGKDSQL